ncbi:hypothetical protein EJ06DRAFT_281935 [Trichodelitschia bisporula]|uniref:Uncharacterized protein n=1 Tax=Trichodelitschia bisporula TaxID=703511 RepID=A0A6G1I5G8_9PEZI|nr:hypothetical protein EJ06DRAFT_281935 [Trichodelitschia bisporula]
MEHVPTAGRKFMKWVFRRWKHGPTNRELNEDWERLNSRDAIAGSKARPCLSDYNSTSMIRRRPRDVPNQQKQDTRSPNNGMAQLQRSSVEAVSSTPPVVPNTPSSNLGPHMQPTDSSLSSINRNYRARSIYRARCSHSARCSHGVRYNHNARCNTAFALVSLSR